MSPTAHLEALAEPSRRLLGRLAAFDWAADLYLAGSAALTLYLGHRPVRDLDLMGVRRLHSPERRDLLQDLLAMDPEVRVERARDGFLAVRCSESLGGVGLRLYYFPYPLIDPEDEVEGVAVASLVDLALMKMAAITSRAGRRDVADLYLITRHLDLESLLERGPEKFGHVRDFSLLALQGLADLGATRDEPLPTLTVDLAWESIEAWVAGDVRDLARRQIGLDRG
ncbi:MAG: nucleotidyl transferase AbiEii/AbiGii toxin family protein [Acidobacteriota bacterium]